MLAGIPKIISPQLIKELMQMGHSDFLIFADANFPAHSHAKKIIRMDCAKIPDLLKAVLPLFPLDNFIKNPVKLMSNLPSEPVPQIWQTYKEIIQQNDISNAFKNFSYIERLKFYEEAKKAYMIIQTGTTERYANIILQKGVI